MGSRGCEKAGPTGTPRGMRAGCVADGSSPGPHMKEEAGRAAYPPAHPALARLCGLLGREAAAFSRRHRYSGLGRLQLIWSQLMQDSNDDNL